MQKEIIAANKAGIQVRLHCIADGSVRMALDLFEKSAEVNGEHRLRNTIEHIENIHPDDLDRFAELDAIPSIQPYHVTLAANGKVNQIGEKRARLQWPFRGYVLLFFLRFLPECFFRSFFVSLLTLLSLNLVT